MATLNLGKPIPLTREKVNKLVNTKPGNFALGFYRKKSNSDEKTFRPKYVGSSFTDLKTEIIQQGLVLKVKKDGTPTYTHFKYSHEANTPIKAFKKECENFHAFKESLVNQNHPKRPKGYTPDNLNCPKKDCKL